MLIPVAGQFVILKCEQIIPESYVPSQNLATVKQRLTDAIRDRKLERIGRMSLFGFGNLATTDHHVLLEPHLHAVAL